MIRLQCVLCSCSLEALQAILSIYIYNKVRHSAGIHFSYRKTLDRSLFSMINPTFRSLGDDFSELLKVN